MSVTGIGSTSTYYYNVNTKRLQSSVDGEEDAFCKWYNGDITKEEVPDTFNGFDENTKEDLMEMFYMYLDELHVDVFEPAINGELCEIGVHIVDAVHSDYSINGKEIFHSEKGFDYTPEEIRSFFSIGAPYKTHTRKDYNAADNSINIAVGNVYDLGKGYRIAIRDSYIDSVGYGNGSEEDDEWMNLLVIALDNLIQVGDQQRWASCIDEKETLVLQDFLRKLGVVTNRPFIINGTKLEVVNGRIQEVGVVGPVQSSIYNSALKRYEEFMYRPLKERYNQVG